MILATLFHCKKVDGTYKATSLPLLTNAHVVLVLKNPLSFCPIPTPKVTPLVLLVLDVQIYDLYVKYEHSKVRSKHAWGKSGLKRDNTGCFAHTKGITEGEPRGH